jgi:hypothetical protein
MKSILFEQRPSEHDLGIPYAVKEVFACVKQLECLTRLLFSEPNVAGSQVDLRQRRDHLGCLWARPALEQRRKSLLEMLNGLIVLAEQKVEPAKVVQNPANTHAVGNFIQLCLGPIRVGASKEKVTFTLGDE